MANLIPVPPRFGVAFAVLDRTPTQLLIDYEVVDRVLDSHTDLVRHAALDVINDYLTGKLREPPPNRQPSTINRQPEGKDATARQTT